MNSSLFTMFVLALLPIIWLVIALCVWKLPAHIASLGAFVVAFIEAMFIWNMSFNEALSASIEGFAMALWPIVLVIIAAVFTYNVTVYTGAMDIIKRMITSISSDRRILVLLIGWCFGGFLEGMAGFGVAIAIPASMLYALGFSPVEAILACLIANGCPTINWNPYHNTCQYHCFGCRFIGICANDTSCAIVVHLSVFYGHAG